MSFTGFNSFVYCLKVQEVNEHKEKPNDRVKKAEVQVKRFNAGRGSLFFLVRAPESSLVVL